MYTNIPMARTKERYKYIIYQFRYAYNTFSGTHLKYLTSPDITWQAVALAAVRQNGLALQCLDETKPRFH